MLPELCCVYKEGIGAKIRVARQRKKLTQEQLGQLVIKSRSTILNAELQDTLTEEVLGRILKALDLDMERLESIMDDPIADYQQSKQREEALEKENHELKNIIRHQAERIKTLEDAIAWMRKNQKGTKGKKS